MTRRIEALEVVWTLLTGGGLLVQVRYLARALGDHAWLIREALNTSAEIATSGNARREKFRVAGQLLLFLVGVLALVSKPAAVRPARSPNDWLAVAFLLVFAALILVEGFLDARDRQKIIRTELREHDDARKAAGRRPARRTRRRWWG